MWKSIAAVSFGAAPGALLRWQLGVRLNALFPTIPPGTLAANLVGAYVIGVSMAFFATYPGVSPEWRLLIVTGFCCGLTTFSTFSAEIPYFSSRVGCCGRPEPLPAMWPDRY